MIIYKRADYPQRTLSVAVRVGNTKISASHGLKQITSNKLCGDTSGSTTLKVVTMHCDGVTHARYVTLQSKVRVELNIGEVQILAASG